MYQNDRQTTKGKEFENAAETVRRAAVKTATNEISASLVQPEGLVADLDLSQHKDGYWPSSRNVRQ